MKKIVVIDAEESLEVERAFYEYNASKDIIGYLMSRDSVKDEHLQKYLDSSEVKYAKVEMLKTRLGNKYMPKDFNPVNYNFDFENNSIIYED